MAVKNFGHLLGIPLFVVICLLFYTWECFDPQLLELSKGMIGIATLYDVDVANRINIFYLLIFEGLIAFVIVNYALDWIYLRYKKLRYTLHWLHGGCIWGCFLWVNTILFDSIQYTALQLLVVGLLGIMIGKLLWRKHFKQDHFWVLLLSIGWLYLVSQCNMSVYWEVAIGCIPFVAIWGKSWMMSIFRQNTLTNPLREFLLYLSIATLALLAGIEICFILGSHQKIVNREVCLLLSSLLGGVVTYSIGQKKQCIIASESFYQKIFYPLLLVVLSLFTYYNPIITASEDMFELANPANAQMRWFRFGELPLFEAFSAHLLSDQLWGWLYIVLNGYKGQTDFMTYYFLPHIFYVLIVYFFLNALFEKPRYSFFSSLFFPFLGAVFPLSYCWALVTLLILLKWQQQPQKPHWAVVALIYSSVLFIWRLDVAIPNVIALGGLLIWISYKECIPKSVLKSIIAHFGIITAFVASIVFGVLLVNKVPIMQNLHQIMEYIGASQAHAYEKLAYQLDRYFYAHYILFPFAATLCVLFVIGVKKRYKLPQTSNIHLRQKYTLLFVTVFYLFNIQRGLVRHSLYENFDVFLSSFLYFWLPLAIIVSLKIGRQYQPLLFTILATFGVANFKYPNASEYNCAIEKCSQNQLASLKMQPLANGSRIVETEKLLPYYTDLAKFMDKNFSSDATFLDFSNTPMLYFYLQRQVPSYFNQYLQNTVTDNLQKYNLDYLQKFDVPIALFANYPEGWGDATDQVPNTLRYRYLSRYIFQEYRPLTQIAKHQLWLKKTQNQPPDLPPIDTVTLHAVRFFKIGHLPILLAKERLDTTKAHHLTIADTIILPSNIVRNKGNLLWLQIDSQTNADTLQVWYGQSGQKNGGFEWVTQVGNHAYAIPLSSQYNWWRTMSTQVFIRHKADRQKLLKVMLLENYPQ